jgi:hypothetical protein
MKGNEEGCRLRGENGVDRLDEIVRVERFGKRLRHQSAKMTLTVGPTATTSGSLPICR